MEFRAVILAAGRGSRLGRHTRSMPKCQVTLANRTLLEWEVRALRVAGVSRIGIIRGYLGTAIQWPGAHYFENTDWRRTNIVASLACAAEWLREAVCVASYGDIVYHPDIVSSVMNCSGDIAVAYDRRWGQLWKARFSDPLADAESLRVRDDQIVQIGRKNPSPSEIDGQYIGLLKLSPQGWSSIQACLSGLSVETRRHLDMTALLQLLIQQGVRIDGVPIFGRWCEVDSSTDLSLYESRIEDGDWSHDWRF